QMISYLLFSVFLNYAAKVMLFFYIQIKKDVFYFRPVSFLEGSIFLQTLQVCLPASVSSSFL
ncbi:hypothetical protein ACMYZ5_11990, partial [Bacteroides sp. KG68]|uniref:hypothetical protein n=1 Tax=Bacteroides sp. KG68 TaxID=3397824 RepID=UPI003D9948C5